MNELKVGVLAFQGAFKEHVAAFERLDVEVREIRVAEDMAGVSHLVIPGGESTVIGRFLESSGLGELISARYRDGGLAIFGTCAGAILLGKSDSEYSLELAPDIVLKRNAYGSQLHSFSRILPLEIDGEDGTEIEAVFIRAPIVDKIEESVNVLARCDERPVLCRSGRILISTFHPELTEDLSIHKYFLSKI
jgi:5'-phosphate synthase pdxT subunit